MGIGVLTAGSSSEMLGPASKQARVRKLAVEPAAVINEVAHVCVGALSPMSACLLHWKKERLHFVFGSPCVCGSRRSAEARHFTTRGIRASSIVKTLSDSLAACHRTAARLIVGETDLFRRWIRIGLVIEVVWKTRAIDVERSIHIPLRTTTRDLSRHRREAADLGDDI